MVGSVETAVWAYLGTKDDVKEDLSYKLEVKGIEPVYKEDDIFKCSFNLYGSDSYVKVFWFTNDDAAMLYPNDYEGDMVFKAGESYTVPVTDAIELVMAKSDPDVDTEFINLVVVPLTSATRLYRLPRRV